MMTADSCFY